MTTLTNMTDSEYELMKIIWARGESTAREILTESLKSKERHYSTIRTLLEIMFEKGFLKRRKLGLCWFYSPKVSKHSITKTAIESFIDDILEDSLSPLFQHLISNRDKYDIQIDELKQLIDNINDNEE